MKLPQTVVFDLDGTIIDSSNEVIKCLKKSFEIVGYPVSEDRFQKTLIGPPLKDIVRNIVPEKTDDDFCDKVIAEFRKLYDNETNDESTLYDGIFEVLQNLRDMGRKLYIATFKPLKPTLRILKQYNIYHFFEDVWSIDKTEKTITKSEMIKLILQKGGHLPEETIMIGDSQSDINAAKENNCLSGAAMWGYGNKQEIAQSADFVFNKCEEILNITERLVC